MTPNAVASAAGTLLTGAQLYASLPGQRPGSACRLQAVIRRLAAPAPREAPARTVSNRPSQACPAGALAAPHTQWPGGRQSHAAIWASLPQPSLPPGPLRVLAGKAESIPNPET